ncbi:MAG: ATP-binding cassette domain-containing protein [Kiloniellales bacterium]|nr:ATP-binding cassette domain-containing protein [Kiloniellales bacterium]
MTEAAPLLAIEGLVRDYLLPRQRLFGPAPSFRALHGIDLTVEAGHSVGIVGESGCGKSTLARLVMALDRPSAGRVRFRGQALFELAPEALRALRRQFQMVFQDPYGSLDPRQKVGRIVAEPLDGLLERLGMAERRERVVGSLAAVGLKASDADKYPHEFSGGQRQRIAIARALITEPALIVADEPVSALDVSVQAQVLNLMMDLQARLGLTYLFISHDLSVVRHVTDRVAVMYQGRIVEQGATAAVFAGPRHPYTQALLAAVPKPDPATRRRGRKNEGPAEVELPTVGCAYAPRCPLAVERCRAELPALRDIAQGRLAACHLA